MHYMLFFLNKNVIILIHVADAHIVVIWNISNYDIPRFVLQQY